MIENDITQWPIVTTRLRSAPSAEDQAGFFEAFTGWLDRGKIFATLRIYEDPGSLTRPRGGDQGKQWFQANVDRIRTLVAAMARVVPADQLEQVRPMANIGIPTCTFDNEAAATQWLAEQVRLAMVEVDNGASA